MDVGTRARILRDVAQVFNTRGYAGTSMSAVLAATGLQKGGVYNHFASKEALAVAAFDYQVEVIAERFEQALAGVAGAVARLQVIVAVIGALAADPVFAGGCPVLNTAVEADDAHPALKVRAQETMTGWLRLVGSIVKEGIRDGEICSDTDSREIASVVVATLEGAVMMSKLCDDPVHMVRAVNHLKEHLKSLALVGSERSGA